MRSDGATNAAIKVELAAPSLESHFSQALSKRDFAARYLSYLSELLTEIEASIIEQIIDALIKAGECGQAIYFIGNGGSAATASHWANDISIGTRGPGAKPFKAISLSDNLAVVTALANDEGYTNVFLRQLDGVLQPGDVVVALSVSGNSPNILEALRYAKEHSAITVGCTGFDGGEVRKIVDINLHVPGRNGEYGPAEDVFTILGHLIYSYLRLDRRGRL